MAKQQVLLSCLVLTAPVCLFQSKAKWFLNSETQGARWGPTANWKALGSFPRTILLGVSAVLVL